MCDRLSFKEYEGPFKNVAGFDGDDSPKVPVASMKNKSDVNMRVASLIMSLWERLVLWLPGESFCTPRENAGGWV